MVNEDGQKITLRVDDDLMSIINELMEMTGESNRSKLVRDIIVSYYNDVKGVTEDKHDDGIELKRLGAGNQDVSVSDLAQTVLILADSNKKLLDIALNQIPKT